MQPSKKIGEVLLERRLITPAQLELALRHQQVTRQFLGMILVEQGALTAQHLLEALSNQFGIPHETISPSQVDWQASQPFAPSALASGTCFPIRADERTVTVAIANPLDMWTLSQLEHAAAPRRVQPILILEGELRQIVETYRQRMLHRLIEERLTDDGDRHETR